MKKIFVIRWTDGFEIVRYYPAPEIGGWSATLDAAFQFTIEPDIRLYKAFNHGFYSIEEYYINE